MRYNNVLNKLVSTNTMQHESVIIVGGGPVGATTAITLARAGKTVTLFDTFDIAKNSDGRVLALSYASIMQLNELGINLSALATPINKVHLSHNGLGRGGPG